MALDRRLSAWLESRRRQRASKGHAWADEDSPAPSTGHPSTDSATGRPEHAVSSKLHSLARDGSFWDALDPDNTKQVLEAVKEEVKLYVRLAIQNLISAQN